MAPSTTAKKTKKAVRTPGTAAPRRGPAKMTAEHKAALAVGREEARHVRAYLDALERHKPRRGRQRTTETIQKQLAKTKQDLASASGMRKLELAARRIDLEKELDAKQTPEDLSELRKNFVKYAANYARRKGIPAKAFREAGVPAADIRDAKIK